MRKTRLLLSIMLAIILAVGLCSCGSKDSDTKEKTEETTDEKADEEGAEVKEEAPAEESEQKTEAESGAAEDAAQEDNAAAEAAKENMEEASEKEPAPELPVEGDYTLFAVQNEGFVVDSNEAEVTSTLTLSEGGTGSMTLNGESIDISEWTISDDGSNTVTITLTDGSSASGLFHNGILDMDFQGTNEMFFLYAQEAADLSVYEILTRDEMVARRNAAETAGDELADTRLGALVAGMDIEKGIHLHYEMKVESMGAVQELDVYAKGTKYYSLRTTTVAGTESKMAVLYLDGKAYNLYPDEKTGTFVTETDPSLIGNNVLLMDSLYSSMFNNATMTEFTQEQREIDGVSYSADIYAPTDYYPEGVYCFTEDGQLAHLIQGAPVIESLAEMGETTYKIYAIDDQVDESLFDLSGYNIAE